MSLDPVETVFGSLVLLFSIGNQVIRRCVDFPFKGLQRRNNLVSWVCHLLSIFLNSALWKRSTIMTAPNQDSEPLAIQVLLVLL
jgi:hypothetical protein